MIKLKCNKCKHEWFSDEAEPCPDDETHKVVQIKSLKADDYMELWGQDLENENRHSLSDMPSAILGVLSKHIKDEKVLTKIMKKLYEDGVGL